MPVRIAYTVAQQHDRAQAHTTGVVGGGGGASEEQAPRPGRSQRATGRREEAEAHVDRGPGKTVAGGVLCRTTAAVGREDRGDRGEARPEKERGSRVVLQPEAKTEAHEVRGPTLTWPARIWDFVVLLYINIILIPSYIISKKKKKMVPRAHIIISFH